jgi:hypothetical protein
MTLLRAWIWLAAVVLVVSLVVHVSTFFGVDPMEVFPGVMFIHLAIFPPFIAAVVYVKKVSRQTGRAEEKLFDLAPKWMRVVVGGFFVYAIANFIIFIFLVQGGGPEQRGSKYYLMSHGHIIRELSEAGYHQMQGYVVRGFSGHWMLFSSGAVLLLTGVGNARKSLETKGYRP